jgi:SAM-dependent methyltransferase
VRARARVYAQVSTLRPFPGQVHLDVAGGTGDVAFRVLAALRQEERLARLAGRPEPPAGGGTVLVADINPAMLAEGRKRADAAGYRSAERAHDEEGVPTCVSACVFSACLCVFGALSVCPSVWARRCVCVWRGMSC